MLELSLFGPFGAVWAGRPLPIGTMAARVALAVLALEPGRSRPRGELARMLWPEQSQSVASTNLRQVVARLRRALPDPDAAVVVSRETLALGEAVRSDVATLTALLAECGRHQHSDRGRCADCARRRERAATLYRGEFGADLVSGGSAMVEDWLLLTRERWHRQAVALLHELGLDQAAAGAYGAALATAERTLQLEPWREEAHRQAMVALAALGDRHSQGSIFLRPDRKDEPRRFGPLGGIRQCVESVFDTAKGQLGLERHGARTLDGVFSRIIGRLLALAASIWHNWQTGGHGRHLTAYDH